MAEWTREDNARTFHGGLPEASFHEQSDIVRYGDDPPPGVRLRVSLDSQSLTLFANQGNIDLNNMIVEIDHFGFDGKRLPDTYACSKITHAGLRQRCSIPRPSQ